jgi:DNA replication protein DnaC
MIKALEDQQRSPTMVSLSFEERLAMIVDSEEILRKNRRFSAKVKSAKFKYPHACIEDLDYKRRTGLEKSLVMSLANCEWIEQHQNIILSGPSGIGKGYIACALASRACQEGYSAYYIRVPRLIDELATAKADGSYGKFLDHLVKFDILILDDWGLPLNETARRDFLEIIEDRYSCRSTIITTQVATKHWPEIIGDPTQADAIMDRIIHNSHEIQMKGPSQRKLRSTLEK